MPPLPAVDILVNSARLGDATAQHTFALARAVQAGGGQAAIVCPGPVGALPPDMADVVRAVHAADYTPARRLTLLQYAAWVPLAERFRLAPGAALFYYHGVTDPALWSAAAGRDLLRTARRRANLVWHAHLALATSPFTAAELHAATGYPEERIRLAPLGFDLAAWANADRGGEAAALRARLGLAGKRVLLYVGRNAEHKRVDLIIAALAALAADYPDLHLLAVGDTTGSTAVADLVAGYRSQAAAAGVADRITFTGRVERVEPYYALADLYVQASDHEGFAAPLVEAMAAGAPVAAAAAGAMPWVLGEGETDEAAGLLFSPGDAAALAAAIRTLLDNPARAAALADCGRRRAQAFDLPAFNARIVALLEEALAMEQADKPRRPYGDHPLYEAADVGLPEYRVRSRAPLVGPLIERLRQVGTAHLKEPYLDRIVAQQVEFNRMLVEEIARLQAEVAELRRQVAARDDKAEQSKAE